MRPARRSSDAREPQRARWLKAAVCDGGCAVDTRGAAVRRHCRPQTVEAPVAMLGKVLAQPRPIKHAHIGFRVAPGGPAVAGRPPGACRRSRGWGRPGGTLGHGHGEPAVGDSGPLLGPDRRAPKQANNSPRTGLYTAFQSAPPRALRHSFPSGIYNADSSLRQPRRACFRPAESLQGSSRSPTQWDRRCWQVHSAR